jgi:protein YIPF5/7
VFIQAILPRNSMRLIINPSQSGKPQFGYIYGVGLLGSASIYSLLNLMSEKGIDAYRVVSVLGYCLLPMVGVGALSVLVTLE